MKKSLVVCILLAFCLLRAHSAEYFVTVNPTNIYSGQSAYIAYSSPTLNNAWDWVGIYPQGEPLQMSKLFFAYGSRSNGYSFQFTVPGNYSVQYFHKSGFALSPPVNFSVTIGPEVYQLSLSTNSVNLGDQMAVSWQSSTNVNIANDFIGLTSTANPNTFIAMVPVWSHSGTAYWTASPPGEYNFGYYKTADNNPVLVTPLARVTVLRMPFPLSSKKLGNNIILNWYGYSGASYQILASTNSAAPITSWSAVKSLTGANKTLAYTNATSGPMKFFTVRESW